MGLNHLLFITAIVFAGVWFGLLTAEKMAWVQLGRPLDRSSHIGSRWHGVVVYVLGQKRLFKDRYSGPMHFVIFWGFIVLSIGTLIFLARGVFPVIPPIRGPVAVGMNILSDLLAGFVLIALGMAAYKRYVMRAKRLVRNLDAALVLGLIAVIVISDVAIGVLTVALHPHAPYDPIAQWLAPAARTWGTTVDIHALLIASWIKLLSLLGFLIYLPYSKHFHLVIAPFNIYHRNLDPRGKLPSLNFADESQESFGVGQITDLTWRDLLDAYACVQCGRCTAVCPANITGKTLSPKSIMVQLREHTEQVGPVLYQGGASTPEEESLLSRSLAGDVILADDLWACTTCGACMEACPVFDEHVVKIVGMRQHLVLTQGVMPEGAQNVFRNIENAGNPWGMAADVRSQLARKWGVKDVSQGDRAEVLYWLGCAGTFDDRAQKVAEATIKLLQEAGVDVGILGAWEQCTGDPAKRMGNEYLFQMQAESNMEHLQGAGAQTIVASCAHCFNTLRNEYPEFGLDVNVVHHSEFLASLVESGALQPRKEVMETVTYHDACYLGRHNGLFEGPRQTLQSIKGLELTEMVRQRENSFCCGAGGGQMWMDDKMGTRINHERAQEALATPATMVATACPYCLIMMKDGLSAQGADNVPVKDFSEILLDAMQAPNS